MPTERASIKRYEPYDHAIIRALSLQNHSLESNSEVRKTARKPGEKACQGGNDCFPFSRELSWSEETRIVCLPTTLLLGHQGDFFAYCFVPSLVACFDSS